MEEVYFEVKKRPVYLIQETNIKEESEVRIIEKERREKENEDAQKNEWEQVFILPACGRNFWHHVPSEPLYLLCSR